MLKDVATVEAARAQKAATGAAVGGLVGGSIVSSMLRHMADLKIGTAVQIGWYRGLAALFQAPGFRQWLTSGLKATDRGKKAARVSGGQAAREASRDEPNIRPLEGTVVSVPAR